MPKNYTKDIFRALGRIEGDIKGVHIQMKQMNGRLIEHDKRINKNESSIDQTKGKAMGAGFIAGIIGTIITIIIGILTFFRRMI